jgi:hypothetical protein
MGMIVRRLRFHVVLASALGLLGSIATAQGQTLVVTAKSVTELVDDLEFVIKTVAPEGDPKTQQMLDALNQFKSGALIKGLDQGRGFGLTVSLPKDFPQGGPPTVVAAVPVTDLSQFLDSLRGLGLNVDDKPGVAGFSHSVTLPDGNTTVFVVESRKYAMVSLVPDDVERIKAMDPASWKPKGRDEADLSVMVRLSEIPDALKDQVLDQVEAQANQQNERKPGESDAEYQGRMAGQKLVLEAFRSLARDGDAISLGLDLNRKTQEIALELAMSGRPDTPMAKTLRAFKGRRSRFQGLSKNAAMAGWASIPVAKELRDMISEGIETAHKAGLSKVDSEEEKKLYTRLGELVKTSLNAPELDLGMAVEATSTKDPVAPRFVLRGGMTVEKGRDFEGLFRDAAKTVKPGENVKVNFDVAKAADGTAIHQITGPSDPKKDADVAKRFGKASLYLAFREDAILFSFGEDALAPLQKTLEGFLRPVAPELDEPVAVLMHFANVGVLADKDPEKIRRAAAEVFKGANAGRDRIHLGLKGEGDEVRIRLAIDVPVLKMGTLMGK